MNATNKTQNTVFGVKHICAAIYDVDIDTAATMTDECKRIRKQLREIGFASKRGAEYRFDKRHFDYLCDKITTETTARMTTANDALTADIDAFHAARDNDDEHAANAAIADVADKSKSNKPRGNKPRNARRT